MRIDSKIKKVVERYPKCIVVRDLENNFFIDDGNGNNLNEKYMVPHLNDIDNLWNQFYESFKINNQIETDSRINNNIDINYNF